MEIEYCTRCRKELTDFRIQINFHIITDVKKENSVWEYLPNLDNKSREVLCINCFDKFSTLMSELNIKKEEKINFLDSKFNGHNEIVFNAIKINNLDINNSVIKLWENCHKFISNAIDKDGTIFDPACGDTTIIKSLALWSKHKLIPYGVDYNEYYIEKAKELNPEYKENFYYSNFNNFDIKKIPVVDYGYYAIFTNHDFINEESINWILKLCSIVKYRLIVTIYGDVSDKDYSISRINNLIKILPDGWNKNPIRLEGERSPGFEAFYFEKI